MTFRAVLLLLVAAAASASAQEPGVPPGAPSSYPNTPVSTGMSYYTFAEPGAPTVEVIFLGTGLRNGVYKLQSDVSLVQALALAGGTPRSDSTKTAVTTATIRVIRLVGGQSQTIYEVVPEQLLNERDRHPSFQTGDVVEMNVDVEYIEPSKKFTFRDGVEIVSRAASLISAVLLIYSRLQ